MDSGYPVDQKLKDEFNPTEYAGNLNLTKNMKQFSNLSTKTVTESSINKKSSKVINYLIKALHQLGYKSTQEDVDKMVSEIDLNKNETVEFSEFLKVNFCFIRDDEINFIRQK